MELLRGYVSRCDSVFGLGRVEQYASQSPVGNFQKGPVATGVAKQDVRGLDVEMGNTVTVGVNDRLTDDSSDPQHLVERETAVTVVEQRMQTAAVDILHSNPRQRLRPPRDDIDYVVSTCEGLSEPLDPQVTGRKCGYS